MNSGCLLTAVELKYENEAVVLPVSCCTDLKNFLADINETCALMGQFFPFSSFEYLDEDGDNILVQEEGDFKALLSYVTSCDEQSAPSVLTIFPVSATANGSPTVAMESCDIKSESSDSLCDNSPSSSNQTKSIRKESSVDLEQLISSGDVHPNLIKYLQPLGTGTSGTVYKALDTKFDRLMAVKSISVDVDVDTQLQIVSEMEILYKCDSSFIIDFFGTFFIDNQIYICTEYMDAGSFHGLGQVPQSILGPVAASVASGLQYLWYLKIMHRDIKPSNILLNRQGAIKLCDFGVSIQLVNSIAKTYVGTNAYMAPERIMGAPYGIHSDIWSYGITLLELGIGRFPYSPVVEETPIGGKVKKPRPVDLIRAILDQEPPVLTGCDFDDDLKSLIDCCLKKEPSLRPVPETLLTHPFIRTNASVPCSVVADWAELLKEEPNG